MKKTNVIGVQFGELLVLDDIRINKNGRYRRYLKCLCSCGNIALKEKSKVVSGYTKSCGHLQKDMWENFGKSRSLGEGVAAFNEIYSQYKKGAKIRGLEFSLTKEQFKKIITKPCIYCGTSSENSYNRYRYNGNFTFTGIDRYDNTKGYSIDNCVPCCKVCNRMKTNLKIEFFNSHIKKIISNSDNWKSLSSEKIKDKWIKE